VKLLAPTFVVASKDQYNAQLPPICHYAHFHGQTLPIPMRLHKQYSEFQGPIVVTLIICKEIYLCP